MKILKGKGKVVFVASDVNAPDNCPRLIVNEKSGKIRDDYHGAMRISKKLIAKMF
ncbi:MAG: hypothetical protein ACP5JN_03515 [Candidatus Micrarchaeia archaeon]|jgi:hypothetical protein